LKGRILYLTYDGLTDPLGQSQVLPYIIGLSQRGYRFTIISFEKEEKFEKLKGEISNVCQEHSIKWIPLRYHKKPPVLSTLFDVWKLWQNVKREYQINSFQIIHCRSYITALVGLKAKQKWNTKFIFDMRGFWADERVEGGLWNLKNPLYKIVFLFFKKREKQFLTQSDVIISLTHNAKNEILNWKIKNTVVIIPCCVDLDQFDPNKIALNQKDLLRKELGIKSDDFVLLYLGSLGTWYQIKEMLIFFIELKKVKSNAKFLIVTNDTLNLTEFPFKEDVIIQKAPRSKVPIFISLSNGSVMFIKPSFSKKASSATKMAEVLAMQIPLIANTGWGDIEYYESRLSGFKSVVNELSYRDAIIFMIGNTKSFEIRNDAALYFSLNKGVESYRDVYESLMKN
jgi:glycosyltransferase involved in cell wall biosynthesis